jgi:uncharacterized membrane protein YphA (DoxX/SURF4 family)
MSERATKRLVGISALYARLALGASFLSAVADRFGLWRSHAVWGNFASFEKYTARVNSFMPASSVPFLAWAATIAEVVLGVALIAGIWTRGVALASALLLALFATAMTVSFSFKPPLDYSVCHKSNSAARIGVLVRPHLAKLEIGGNTPQRSQKNANKTCHE